MLFRSPVAVAAAPVNESAPAPAVVAAVEPAPAVVTVVVPEPPPAQGGAPQPTRIVIQPGNNLWVLSRELYGYGKMYTVIYEANKDQIRNPRLIFPGQILTAPVAQSVKP